MLDPSRQIVEGYRPTIVATADGRVLSGIVKGESAQELTLVDADGHRQVVRKSEIEKRSACDTSLMPDRLAAGLELEDFADLIAYLEGLRSPGQGTPSSASHGPTTLPKGFHGEVVARGITGATALAVAADGRIFVCEQPGKLRVIKDGTLLSQPFLTVEADHTWERGLIGVALDPGFAHNFFVYVCYVTPKPFVHHRISRFTARGDVALTGSEVVLFEGDDQAKLGGDVPGGHQGGAIHFGNDGKLYCALGDQTAGRRARADDVSGQAAAAQSRRLDPGRQPLWREGTRQVPGDLGTWPPQSVYLRGAARNRTDHDQRRGQRDLGGNQRGPGRHNYGWPDSEGPTADRRFRPPVHHYPAASIAGGAFCPSRKLGGFPSRYQGKYFFMDFVRGWIKTLDPGHPESVETFATGLTRPVDLAFGADGPLYVLVRDAWVIDENFCAGTGSLIRIRAQSDGVAYAPSASVRVSETTIHGDMDCFKIETPTATYVYGKRGAGFASILDKDGRDWISYRPGGNARGEYRGLPKCGQPTKFFHCGYGYGQYKTDNPFSSRVMVQETGHARVESQTRDGKSACVWDFYPDHATFTLLRIDSPAYWFLYEGVPGGRLDAANDSVIRPGGQKTALEVPWSQVVPWVCFGAVESPVGFLCINHQEPEPGEADSYVSWPFVKEPDGSFQDMTVFGFGRKGHDKLVKHIPDLNRLPARYSIAFVDRADHAAAKATYERLRHAVDQEVAPVPSRSTTSGN